MTIDWSKPVRFKSDGMPIEVLSIHNEYAFITWGDRIVPFISDTHGKIKGAYGSLGVIENTPEEKPDTIILKLISDGRWKFVLEGPVTRSAAESILKTLKAEYSAFKYKLVTMNFGDIVI